MAKRTVFYSWQSDLPKGTNWSFVEGCLNKAIKELRGAAAALVPITSRIETSLLGDRAALQGAIAVALQKSYYRTNY